MLRHFRPHEQKFPDEMMAIHRKRLDRPPGDIDIVKRRERPRAASWLRLLFLTRELTLCPLPPQSTPAPTPDCSAPRAPPPLSQLRSPAGASVLSLSPGRSRPPLSVTVRPPSSIKLTGTSRSPLRPRTSREGRAALLALSWTRTTTVEDCFKY